MRYNHFDMLPEKAFKPVLKRMTLEGGGSGGGGGPQTTTSYSTNLPEYAAPYYNELLKQTGRETFSTNASGAVTGVKPFRPYTGNRVAGFTPEQLAAQGEVRDMATPEGFAQGTAGLTAGQLASLGATSAGLGQALGYQAGPMERMGMSDTPIFNQGIAQYYMSPFQTGVTDIAVRQAQTEADRQRAQSAMGAIGRGTFGGARDTLAQSLAKANTMQNVSDLRYKGQQDAFTQAQQQFERDRSASMGAEEKTLAAEVARRQLEEQARQYESGLGKDLFSTGLAGLTDTSKGLGAMAATEQESDLARLRAQAASGAEKQALTQKGLDMDYQQAMEARDWNQKQLEFYSNILRGNAGALGSTQVNYAPAPSAASQIAGLGLAGLGLSKALT
jgi:hypothetical protein